MFIILKNDHFQLWCLYKSDLLISSTGNKKGIIRIKHFQNYTNFYIFHIIDQMKNSRVQLWIVHCHFFMVGHLKLCFQSLKELDVTLDLKCNSNSVPKKIHCFQCSKIKKWGREKCSKLQPAIDFSKEKSLKREL